MVKLSKGDDLRKLRIEVCGVPAYCMNIEECMSVEVEADKKPWYHDIKAYIKNSEYPSNATDNERKFISHMACQFFLSGKVLYKWNHDSTLLQCVDVSEANHLMEEMHEGLLGAYASGPCWPTRSWEPIITGSPWKTIALNMWGHATIAKPIKTRRTLLLSLCILWRHHGPSQPGIWMSSNPWFWKLQMVMSTS